jgi:hypothetical protein
MGKRNLFLFSVFCFGIIFLSSCKQTTSEEIVQSVINAQTEFAPIIPKETISIDTPTLVVLLGKITGESTTLKSEANWSSTTVEILYKGEFVEIKYQDQDNKWIYIKSTIGNTGWIPSSQLAIAQGITLPIIDSSTSTATPKPTLTATITRTPIKTPTPLPTATIFVRSIIIPTTNIPNSIPWPEAANYTGERKTVCGYVAGTSYATSINGQPTYLNIGNDYPTNPRFTVIIWGEHRNGFSSSPETYYNHKTICVYGLIVLYKGTPQIEVISSSQITIQ